MNMREVSLSTTGGFLPSPATEPQTAFAALSIKEAVSCIKSAVLSCAFLIISPITLSALEVRDLEEPSLLHDMLLEIVPALQQRLVTTFQHDF